MRKSIAKILASTLAVATVAGSLVATSGSAQAGFFNNPGALNGMHMNNGAAVQNAGWHGGGFGWGAAGFIGGMAAGAVIAGAANANANPTYPCGAVRQRVYDAYGNFAGYRYVSAC